MKTERKNNLKNLGLIVGGLTLSTFAATAGSADMFAVNAIGSGGEIRSELTAMARNTVNNELSSYLLEAKCGETGAKATKTTKGEKGKSAEAKCGEGKCGEGKCGESKKAASGEKGKTSEAKCGEKGKSTEAKCGEK